MKIASPPAFLMLATTPGPLRSSTSVTATEAPSRANNSDTASPMRGAPPDRNASRYSERLSGILGQRMTEFLADAAKRDAVDDGAVAGFEPHPQMRLP